MNLEQQFCKDQQKISEFKTECTRLTKLNEKIENSLQECKDQIIN